jgi:hypothetical protein
MKTTNEAAKNPVRPKKSVAEFFPHIFLLPKSYRTDRKIVFECGDTSQA